MDFNETPLWPAGAAPDPHMCAEHERARVLAAYGLDDLEDDPELESITRFAAQLCKARSAAVSIVRGDIQHFVAHNAMPGRETPRSTSFCATAMLGDGILIVPDASQDPRFADFTLVTGAEHVRFYAGVPLISVEGAPVGALCVVDSTPHREGLDELQREGLTVLAQAVMRRLCGRRTDLANLREIELREQRLFRLIEGLPEIAWSADADGNFDFFNSRWQAVTGKAPPVTAEGWREFVHPEDHDSAFGAWYASFERHEPFEAEYRFRQADGSWRWVLSRGLLVSGGEGEAARWFGTLTDIDDSHRQSETRELLANELSHRIKNIFAVVTSLISLRARNRPDASVFAEELIATIHALGRAHEYVRPVAGHTQGTLGGLIDDLMAPYADVGESRRIAVTGDDCAIGPRAATPLALVFHELATNSAKYGALSVPEGRLSILIECRAEAITIRWTESGGPPARPGAKGFGSRLVELAVKGQLGGELSRTWADQGLVACLAIPSASVRD